MKINYYALIAYFLCFSIREKLRSAEDKSVLEAKNILAELLQPPKV